MSDGGWIAVVAAIIGIIGLFIQSALKPSKEKRDDDRYKKEKEFQKFRKKVEKRRKKRAKHS